MELIADTFMAAGAFGASLYCYVLAQRLKRFSTLEGGMGGAIAVLSAQVDDMTKALERARTAATSSTATLEALTGRAEAAASRLELLLASMHDIPPARPEPRADPEQEAERRLRFVRRRTFREDVEAEP